MSMISVSEDVEAADIASLSWYHNTTPHWHQSKKLLTGMRNLPYIQQTNLVCFGRPEGSRKADNSLLSDFLALLPNPQSLSTPSATPSAPPSAPLQHPFSTPLNTPHTHSSHTAQLHQHLCGVVLLNLVEDWE